MNARIKTIMGKPFVSKIMASLLALLATLAMAAIIAVPVYAGPIVLRYAHFHPAKDNQPLHKGALIVKEHIEKATGGAIRVQIYPAGQFGKDIEVMEGIKLGSLHMAAAHDGAVASIFKPIQLLGIPYLYDSHAHAWRVYDSPFGDELNELMVQRTGVRLLALADNGVRHFTNSVRPVRTPADLRGLKLRIQPSPVYQALVESLGASASAIPWAELPAALQSKVVDGQENGVTNILSASLYQYQKYATLDGHVWSVHAYMINEQFFRSLRPSHQAAILEGVRLARDAHRKMTSSQDLAAREILEKQGMQVTVLSPQEIDTFRAMAQQPVRRYVEQAVGKAWVDKLFAAIEAQRQPPALPSQ